MRIEVQQCKTMASACLDGDQGSGDLWRLNCTSASRRHEGTTMSDSLIGHNISGATIRVEVRFFNSLARFTRSPTFAERIEVAAGATVGDLIQRFRLPIPDIFLVLKNGRDITPGLYQGGVVNTDAALDDGDTIAFSGPVPYSYGYGAPVV
jgi:molybdopterin converting factor small subunit